MIQPNDFRRQWQEVREDALAVFERVGASGWYVLGEEVCVFEREIAALWGCSEAVGVGSGLDAIEVSLRALGCGTGDRVLTTPLSAFATTLAIVKTGAIPVFVDTDANGLIDLERCRQLLARRADIGYFVPVHLYGQALDMVKLDRLRDDYSLRMVEDCAQSVAARFHGRATGSAGQLGATSFYPTKNLGAMGDGGAILSSSVEFTSLARALRDYGQTAKYRHDYVGCNSRLDELQAALLRSVYLPRLDHWTVCRRRIASAYRDGIHNSGIRLLSPPEGSEPSWHLFPVWLVGGSPQDFAGYMCERGITVGNHYPTIIPDQRALAGIPIELADPCDTARRLCANEVSLPIHPYLTEKEVAEVIEAVNAWPAR